MRKLLTISLAIALVLAYITFYNSDVISEPSPERNEDSNKARLGMNLTSPGDSSTEYAFSNMFVLTERWNSGCEGLGYGKGPALNRDKNGWVKNVEPNCFAEVFLMGQGHRPHGDYTLLYDGEGEINIKQGTKIPPYEKGKYIINVHDVANSVIVQILKTNRDNYIKNIRFIIPGYEDNYEDMPFYHPFLDRWKSFDTFRFMDWMKTNNSKIEHWDQRPAPTFCNYTEKGVPVEIMVKLCNTQKINPWFCMPHLADDDYVRQFATSVKNSLDPNLKIYIEYSNEVWNNIFEQHQYAQKKGIELGLGPKDAPWESAAMFYAMRSQQIFKIWEEVYGGRDSLIRVIACQAASDANWIDRVILEPNNVGHNADVLAIAPYITFMVGPETNPNVSTVAQWGVDQVFDYVEKKSFPESIQWIKNQKKLADKYDLKLVCYEAGQHLLGILNGENNDDLTKLFIAANSDSRMGDLYTQYLNAWKENGGDLMCLFSSTAKWSKWGCWGLTEYMDQTEADVPKYKAVMDWIRKNQL